MIIQLMRRQFVDFRFNKSSFQVVKFCWSKKNKELRLCVDYRRLNKITIKNRHSLFNISELQNRLQEVIYYMKLNLREAYNLIWMKAEEEWKIVFRSRYNLCKYLMISSILTDASTTCQKIFKNILREY